MPIWHKCPLSLYCANSSKRMSLFKKHQCCCWEDLQLTLQGRNRHIVWVKLTNANRGQSIVVAPSPNDIMLYNVECWLLHKHLTAIDDEQSFGGLNHAATAQVVVCYGIYLPFLDADNGCRGVLHWLPLLRLLPAPWCRQTSWWLPAKIWLFS